MYTDYINGEERCRVIARKLIYWVAVVTCTGGVFDALGMPEIVRARATTAPFMSRPAQVAVTVERVPMHVSDFVAEDFAAASGSLAEVAPSLQSTLRPFRLASADAGFEAALTKLALRSMPGPMPEVMPTPTLPVAPAALESHAALAPAIEVPKPPELEQPTARSGDIVAPAAAVTPAEPSAPVIAVAVQLPDPADVPLPLPRPPLTPAQELGLEGIERAKAEKCLAQAIYFEARNEPIRGQIAVAQVVLNRVFSPYYPDTVCSVVFQNAHRFLSCQFTFACDGKSKAIRERGAWVRAQRIAKQALDAQVWLPDVAKSTHYHATYVRPNWIREMKKMVKHGTHIFYRPHRWGDGADEAGWGVASLLHLTSQKPKSSKHN